jgi:hypothetical protein
VIDHVLAVNGFLAEIAANRDVLLIATWVVKFMLVLGELAFRRQGLAAMSTGKTVGMPGFTEGL